MLLWGLMIFVISVLSVFILFISVVLQSMPSTILSDKLMIHILCMMYDVKCLTGIEPWQYYLHFSDHHVRKCYLMLWLLVSMADCHFSQWNQLSLETWIETFVLCEQISLFCTVVNNIPLSVWITSLELLYYIAWIGYDTDKAFMFTSLWQKK